jgi:hypothetical protein
LEITRTRGTLKWEKQRCKLYEVLSYHPKKELISDPEINIAPRLSYYTRREVRTEAAYSQGQNLELASPSNG